MILIFIPAPFGMVMTVTGITQTLWFYQGNRVKTLGKLNLIYLLNLIDDNTNQWSSGAKKPWCTQENGSRGVHNQEFMDSLLSVNSWQWTPCRALSPSYSQFKSIKKEQLIRTLSCWLFREKIHYIRTEGTQGVEKLSCDADLVILLR